MEILYTNQYKPPITLSHLICSYIILCYSGLTAQALAGKLWLARPRRFAWTGWGALAGQAQSLSWQSPQLAVPCISTPDAHPGNLELGSQVALYGCPCGGKELGGPRKLSVPRKPGPRKLSGLRLLSGQKVERTGKLSREGNKWTHWGLIPRPPAC